MGVGASYTMLCTACREGERERENDMKRKSVREIVREVAEIDECEVWELSGR